MFIKLHADKHHLSYANQASTCSHGMEDEALSAARSWESLKQSAPAKVAALPKRWTAFKDIVCVQGWFQINGIICKPKLTKAATLQQNHEYS